MNITRNQWFGIIGVILSALMTSTAFLNDSFGPTMAHSIVGTAGFINMVMNGIVVILTGQGQQVKDVANMTGVDRVSINSQANSALASVATDPNQPKIGATDSATRTVLQDTAKGS